MMWLAWVVVTIIAIMSVVLLAGKGSFLIAGYNTASKEAKQKYDAKKICRVIGGGLGICTVMTAVATFYEFEGFVVPWLMPIGLLATILVMAILANTVFGVKSK